MFYAVFMINWESQLKRYSQIEDRVRVVEELRVIF